LGWLHSVDADARGSAHLREPVGPILLETLGSLRFRESVVCGLQSFEEAKRDTRVELRQAGCV